jgi:transcriptional regulator with XRE-family HTH domain
MLFMSRQNVYRQNISVLLECCCVANHPSLEAELEDLPVHGPDGRIAYVRELLGLRQIDLARELRSRGGRASRETVSHWENLTNTGEPRAKITRRNAKVLADLVELKLGLRLPTSLLRGPPPHSTIETVIRTQDAMAAELAAIRETLEAIQVELVRTASARCLSGEVQ